jgi:hypothetical protein
MAVTVEYYSERASAYGDATSVSSTLAVQRERERFASEAEAVEFIAHLPPLREPVLVMEDGERISGSALSLRLVQWQANDAH